MDIERKYETNFIGIQRPILVLTLLTLTFFKTMYIWSLIKYKYYLLNLLL